MNRGVIGRYDTFNTKGCPDDLIFGYLDSQPIPSKYYNFLNDDDEDGNNIPGTPIEYTLTYNKGLEYEIIPNDEYINNEIIIYDDYRLASDVDPPPNEMM